MGDYLILGSVAFFLIVVAIVVAGARKRVVIFYDWKDFWLNMLAAFGPLGMFYLSGTLSEPLRPLMNYSALALYVTLTCYNFYTSLRFNAFLPLIFNLTVALLKQFLTVFTALFSMLQVSRVFGENNTQSDKALGGALLVGALTLLASCVNGSEVAERRGLILRSEA